MAELLYLDTARLGRMSPAAQQAHRDFAALAGVEGGSLYFERLLSTGAAGATEPLRIGCPAPAAWQGVSALKRSLRGLAGSADAQPVLLANRSAQLMKLAARLLFLTCRNVLTADVAWPPYHAVLEAERVRVGRRVTTAAVRREVFEKGLTAGGLADRLAEAYRVGGCDGLFLPAVSHDGIRLPVEAVVRKVEAEGELRFAVVDGAQGFCHVSADVGRGYCDLFLAGCHKWLGAYLPLGVAFYGRLCSRQVIDAEAARMLAAGEFDDPLFRFTSQLERGGLDGTTETVSIASLFTAQAAAAAAAAPIPEVLTGRVRNAHAVAARAPAAGWEPVLPDRSLESGILLLRDGRADAAAADPAAVRGRFHDAGVALTAYPGGTVRLSMPAEPLGADDLARLDQAFQLAA